MKRWHIYTTAYNATAYKTEMMSFAGIETELQCLILSETNQIQRNKRHVFPIMCSINFLKIHGSGRVYNCWYMGKWGQGGRQKWLKDKRS